MSKEQCECGEYIAPLGRAAHLRGNSHRCGVLRSRLEAQGYVELLGTTSRHVQALSDRGYTVVGFPHWSPGGANTPGYESACVGVLGRDLFRLAGPNSTPGVREAIAYRIRRQTGHLCE